MRIHPQVASAVMALATMIGIGFAVASPAWADDSGTLTWPDPNEPAYWDANENAGGTGPAPPPTDDLYWKEGEDAGGTGNAPQPSGPQYTDEGENAGAY